MHVRRYPADRAKGAAQVRQWSLQVAREWRELFATATLTSLDAQSFESKVVDDLRMWVVLFTDGVACGPCRAARTIAKPNMAAAASLLSRRLRTVLTPGPAQYNVVSPSSA